MKTKQLNQCMIAAALAFAISITGCKKDEPEPNNNTTTPGAYETGVFVANEGTFSGSGTLSFYNRTSKTVSNDIFETENNYPLGNIVQSVEIYNGKGYIVVSNAGKVEVVTAGTFKSAGVINGLTMPRYFLGIDNNKGYISEWGTGGSVGAVKVVDLNTNSITSTISTGKGAEKMVKSGNFVYVVCDGGFDKDSVVTVIDATTNTVSDTIYAGPNPDDIKIDANGNIWVLCAGQFNSSYTALEKPGRLVKINSTSNTVELSLDFASTLYSGSPSNLAINSSKNKLYYGYEGKTYSHEISATTLSSSAIINRSFYGLGVDPSNDYIMGADAGSFSADGWVIRYSAIGAAVDSFQVGIGPNGFCFK